MISIVIPVLDEAAIVGEALARLLSQPGDYEVVVVDGGSDDPTPEIVAGFPVTLVRRPAGAPRGFGFQSNLGAETARGDVLLFLHVDVRLPAGAIGLVQAALAAPGVVGGGFLPTFGGAGSGLDRLTLGGIERVWRARTRLGRWFAGDTAPFVRRTLFARAGGYPIQPLAEDWAFAARLRGLGRLAVIERPVLVDARRHLANGPLKTLLVTGSVEAMYHLGVPPAYLAWWYRRWLPRAREARALRVRRTA